MIFDSKEGRFGVNWIGVPESNTVKTTSCTLHSPITHKFNRLYCGWVNVNSGEYTLVGKIRMLRGSQSVAEIPFGWQTKYVAGVVVPTYFALPFTVDRRTYGTGNDYPYSLPASPNCKIASISYQEFESPFGNYHAQITMQPLSIVEEFDRVTWDFEFRSGSIVTAGAILGVCSVDASLYPF